MSSVNKAIILGRLGRDPEVRTLPNGTALTSFSLATSEKYKDKTTGENKEIAEWSNCTAFGKAAEILGKYLKKGDQVYVEGKLKTRSWEKDGVTRYATDIIVSDFTLLGGKKENSGSSQSEPQYASSPSDGASSTDDLPF